MVMRTTRIAPIQTHVILSSIPKYREIASHAITHTVHKSQTRGTKADVILGKNNISDESARITEVFFFMIHRKIIQKGSSRKYMLDRDNVKKTSYFI